MSDNEVHEDVDNDNDVEGETRFVGVNLGRLRSAVWDRFTVIDKKNHIASCNSCEKRLSFRTTVTNLKKHITRKHPCAGYRFRNHSSALDGPVRSRISFQRENKHFDVRKSKLTELGGLEGLIVNVIGDTETLVADDEANDQEEIYSEEVHDYCATDNRPTQEEEKSSNKDRRANKPQQTSDPVEKRKKIRLMDLQLECLELKKYNMQLEARLLEQQLNIRRSIYTDCLQNADTITRGTQTEVGGEKTKIFYLADGKGGVPTRHLFTMQELE